MATIDEDMAEVIRFCLSVDTNAATGAYAFAVRARTAAMDLAADHRHAAREAERLADALGVAEGERDSLFASIKAACERVPGCLNASELADAVLAARERIATARVDFKREYLRALAERDAAREQLRTARIDATQAYLRATAERDAALAEAERLAEALLELVDLQNGPPLPTWEPQWTAAMGEARAALLDHARRTEGGGR